MPSWASRYSPTTSRLTTGVRHWLPSHARLARCSYGIRGPRTRSRGEAAGQVRRSGRMACATSSSRWLPWRSPRYRRNARPPCNLRRLPLRTCPASRPAAIATRCGPRGGRSGRRVRYGAGAIRPLPALRGVVARPAPSLYHRRGPIRGTIRAGLQALLNGARARAGGASSTR